MYTIQFTAKKSRERRNVSTFGKTLVPLEVRRISRYSRIPLGVVNYVQKPKGR